MAKISKDQAKEEVKKWLNSKGYDEDNGDIIQTLKFPICEVESGDTIHAEIAYKPRVKVKELNRRQDQLKVKDADSKTRVGIYASSNVKDAFMDRMDPMDYRVATYIGIFLVV